MTDRSFDEATYFTYIQRVSDEGQDSSDTYLSESALHGTKKICFLQPIVIAANVVDLKPQPLHLFEVEVHGEQLGEDRVYTGPDHFRPVNLPNGREIIGVNHRSEPDT